MSVPRDWVEANISRSKRCVEIMNSLQVLVHVTTKLLPSNNSSLMHLLTYSNSFSLVQTRVGVHLLQQLYACNECCLSVCLSRLFLFLSFTSLISTSPLAMDASPVHTQPVEPKHSERTLDGSSWHAVKDNHHHHHHLVYFRP